MKIKVCGMRAVENIAALATLPIDFIGFIFYKKSARFVDTEPEHIRQLWKNDNFKNIKKVGVFVNETLENIVQIVTDFQLDVVQLHGKESNDFIDLLRKNTTSVIIFKAISIAEQSDFEQTSLFPSADFLLLDTKTPLHGGSGQKFDWHLLKKNKIEQPFFLSGGISATDALEIKNLTLQNFYGVDVNSKFEIEPALKNIELLQNFIATLQN